MKIQDTIKAFQHLVVERANDIKWAHDAQSRFIQDLKGNTSNKEKGKALASKEGSKPGNNVKCSGHLLKMFQHISTRRPDNPSADIRCFPFKASCTCVSGLQADLLHLCRPREATSHLYK